MKIRRLYLRSQVDTFVIFLVGRVGSTYLTTLLQSHPDILALSEELRDREELGAQDQLAWSNRFLTPPLVGMKAVRGFNVKLVHLVDPEAFAQLLRDKGCKILHMQRRNRVKAVVSRLNGRRLHKKTGMWGLFDKANRLPPMTVDLREFDQLLQHREEIDGKVADYVKSLQLPTLNLFYEDLLRDKEAFLVRLFDFLGVQSRHVQGKTLKITSDDLRKAIINFDDLYRQYEGTEYAQMLDEVTIP